MTAAVLQNLHKPRMGEDSITLDLVTQTPLYTGGIGQWGDQIHPSGLLGSIRFFSCLVARTLGDTGFEDAVWGNAGGDNHHARGVALRWDVTGLKSMDMEKNIKLESPSETHRGWFFNCAWTGSLHLQITKRKITEIHWQILLLALRIQVKQAMFGAKDQFGFGVLACRNISDIKIEGEDFFEKIVDLNANCNDKNPTLKDAFFVRFRVDDTQNTKQKSALELRREFRNRFRKDIEDPRHDIYNRIRHYICGHLGGRNHTFGSGFNISGYYPIKDNRNNQFLRTRAFLLMPHTSEPPWYILDNREEIIRIIEEWMQSKPDAIFQKHNPNQSISKWLLGLAK